MDTANEITVEAEVHDQNGARSGRAGTATNNSVSSPTVIPKKKRGPKPKTSSGNTAPRMTINALSSIVSEMRETQDSRVDTLEKEMRETKNVLK